MYYNGSFEEALDHTFTLLQARLQVVLYVILCQVLHERTVCRQIQQSKVQCLAQEVLLLFLHELFLEFLLAQRLGVVERRHILTARKQRILRSRRLRLRLRMKNVFALVSANLELLL